VGMSRTVACMPQSRHLLAIPVLTGALLAAAPAAQAVAPAGAPAAGNARYCSTGKLLLSDLNRFSSLAKNTPVPTTLKRLSVIESDLSKLAAAAPGPKPAATARSLRRQFVRLGVLVKTDPRERKASTRAALVKLQKKIKPTAYTLGMQLGRTCGAAVLR